ncbi:MAG TPA: DUF4838 domain-containing protein [Chthoniobacteraceae bacterium]|nr:DUF4838 domain-containing protein [Chthoniobacteraceae bacterium]
MPANRLFQTLFMALLALMLSGCRKAPEEGVLTLVSEEGGCIPVILSPEATPSARAAAGHLCELIGIMSGRRPELITGTPDPVPDSAIWVGYQPRLAERFPDRSFELTKPEEIHLAANGRHLAIIGRDRIVNGRETEFGTSHAVYTFLQKYLGVRWFWPGALGQDVPVRKTISLPFFDDRFHPVFRQREFSNFPKVMTGREENRRWLEVLQRGRGSLELHVGHGFASWWERYHEAHPDIFALWAPGTRTPEGSPQTVKLCDSNPMVTRLWLEEASQALRDDGALFSISATPNDSGGWCLCEACKAWDAPDGPPSEYVWGGKPYPYVMLTDRMVRFWNGLGRGLKALAPDREVYVGALAYSRYRTPPVRQVLEDNIIVGYVGAFPLVGPERNAFEKEQWSQWAAQARLMMYRPNLFWYTGGVWGLPNIVLEETAGDFRFLAQNHCIGLYVDTLFFNWATAGPQNYLMAQLAYDPMADGAKIMEDYYRRAFGPAAKEVAAYFGVMSRAVRDFMSWEGFFPSGGIRYSSTAVFPETFSPALLDEAEAFLDQAVKKTGNPSGVYRERVAFVRTGLDFTRLQLEIMQAMRKVRESHGGDRAALGRAQTLIASREQLLETAPPFAFDVARLRNHVRLRKMEDYLGPVAEKFLNVPGASRSMDSTPPPVMDPTWNRDLD